MAESLRSLIRELAALAATVAIAILVYGGQISGDAGAAILASIATGSVVSNTASKSAAQATAAAHNGLTTTKDA